MSSKMACVTHHALVSELEYTLSVFTSITSSHMFIPIVLSACPILVIFHYEILYPGLFQGDIILLMLHFC